MHCTRKFEYDYSRCRKAILEEIDSFTFLLVEDIDKHVSRIVHKFASISKSGCRLKRHFINKCGSWCGWLIFESRWTYYHVNLLSRCLIDVKLSTRPLFQNLRIHKFTNYFISTLKKMAKKKTFGASGSSSQESGPLKNSSSRSLQTILSHSLRLASYTIEKK